jgi:hypothetical protein
MALSNAEEPENAGNHIRLHRQRLKRLNAGAARVRREQNRRAGDQESRRGDPNRAELRVKSLDYVHLYAFTHFSKTFSIN